MTAKVTASSRTVVVAGAMNPAIHHPYWYASCGILSNEEAKTAVSGGTPLLLPQIAQFRLGKLQIHCTPETWSAGSPDAADKARVLDLAAKTFAKLSETPINAYGINRRAELVAENVGGRLGELLFRKALDLSVRGMEPDFDAISVQYKLDSLSIKDQPRVDRTLTAKISRSRKEPNSFVVDFNGHHEIDMTQKFGHFDLDVMLRASTDIEEKEEMILQKIVSALSAVVS